MTKAKLEEFQQRTALMFRGSGGENFAGRIEQQLGMAETEQTSSLPIFFLTYYSTLSGDHESFLGLKEWIGSAEIVFGGYIGIIVADIFNIGKQNND